MLALNVPSKQLHLVLLLQGLHDNLPLLGREVLFEFAFRDHGRALLQYFIVVLIVLARGCQRALGAPPLRYHHV